MNHEKVKQVIKNTPKKYRSRFAELFYELKVLEQGQEEQHKREMKKKLKVINGMKKSEKKC